MIFLFPGYVEFTESRESKTNNHCRLEAFAKPGSTRCFLSAL